MSSQKKKGMNLERKQNLTGWAFLMPATILIAWMSFYPMIQAFILSLQTGMGINLKFNGFANYALVDPMENLTIEPVPVVLGRQELVQVQAQGAGTILIDKALAGSVTCAVELDESVTAPVLKGQQLGTLRVEAGGRLLREIALAAAQEVPALGFPDIWRMMLERVCMAG